MTDQQKTDPADLQKMQIGTDLDHAELGRLMEVLRADRLPECSFDDGRTWELDGVGVAETFARAADAIESLTASRDAYREQVTTMDLMMAAVRAERDEAVKVMTDIAKGETPPERNGHYLAHRQAVTAARTFLQSIARETGK